MQESLTDPQSPAPSDLFQTANNPEKIMIPKPEIQQRDMAKFVRNLFKSIYPPIAACNEVLEFIESERVGFLLAGEYEKAEMMEKASKILLDYMKAESKRQESEATIDALYSHWLELQKQSKDVIHSWDEKITKFKTENTERLKTMVAKQKVEDEEFQKKWSDQSVISQFTKPSNRLIQMRDLEKAMAVSRMYSDARKAKEEADTIEKEEIEVAKQRIEAQMEKEQKILSDKHQKEQKAHQTFAENEIQSMEYEKQNELRPILNAIQQIKAKRPQRQKTSQAPPIRPAMITKSQQLFTKFKAERKPIRLDLKVNTPGKSTKKQIR